MVKEEEAAVNKNGKGRGREQSAQDQLMLSLRGLARAALWDTVVISGLAFVEEEMEAERAALCGPRYAHLAERQTLRSGHVASSLVMGGRRVKVERPRARGVDGLPNMTEPPAICCVNTRQLQLIVTARADQERSVLRRWPRVIDEAAGRRGTAISV